MNDFDLEDWDNETPQKPKSKELSKTEKRFGKLDFTSQGFEKVLLYALITFDFGLLIYTGAAWFLLQDYYSVHLISLSFFLWTMTTVTLVNMSRFAFLIIWNGWRTKKMKKNTFASEGLGL